MMSGQPSILGRKEEASVFYKHKSTAMSSTLNNEHPQTSDESLPLIITHQKVDRFGK